MRHPIKTTDLKLVGFKPCVDIFANTRRGSCNNKLQQSQNMQSTVQI